MSTAQAGSDGGGIVVRDLHLGYVANDVTIEIVQDVSFSVPMGGTLALVGESGTGKSLTARSLLGILPDPVRVLGGSITVDGIDITNTSEAELQKIRGGRVGFVPQDPMSALNPVRRIRSAFSEVLRRHTHLDRSARRRRAESALARVGLRSTVLDRYPHQLSGGMKQRIMIALVLAVEPAVVVADEPTTALDATVQAEILDLLAEHVAGHMALVLITHDLGVAATVCQQIAVMYGGRFVEYADSHTLLETPAHPYTRGLLAASPDLDPDVECLVPIPGAPPSPLSRPEGCGFRPRCAFASQTCLTRPALQGMHRKVACWHPVVGARDGH
jgi:oligopeptide/dipeptide ABC transporter ATP-binding protein